MTTKLLTACFVIAAVLAPLAVRAEDSDKDRKHPIAFVKDSIITTKVKKEILEEPGLKSAEINVETFKGVVQLSGFVSTAADQRKAVELARSIKGVKSVKNDMRAK